MRIASVGFTPIKGTRHTAYDEVRLDGQGPLGDRAFCLVDPASRRVLRTVQNPSLVAVRTRLDGPQLHAVLPSGASADAEPIASGERLTCDYWGRRVDLTLLDGPHAELFSSYLGFPVRLAAAPPGSIVYGAPVTVVTSASLRELATRMERPQIRHEAARFRATVVLDVDAPAHVEDTWTGRELQLGDARVRVGEGIPRCGVIDLDPATGVRDAPVLRTLAGYRPRAATGEPCFGVYAAVTRPGRVSQDAAPG